MRNAVHSFLMILFISIPLAISTFLWHIPRISLSLLRKYFLKRLWLAILLFSNFAGNAQHISGLDKDSLRHRIGAAPPDTNKVKALLKLGEDYTLNSPDDAVNYLNMANALSNQLNYPAGKIRYRFLYSGVLESQGKFEEALKLSLEAVDIAKGNNLKHFYAIALSNVASDYQLNGQYAMAVEYYLKALPLMEDERNPDLDVIYGNLSGVYNLLNQPDKALVYARKSVAVAEQKNDADAKGASYGNLGNILYSLNKLDESIKYNNMAYRLASEVNDKNLAAISLLNMGSAYTEKKEFDNANTVNKKALLIAEELNDAGIKSNVLYGMAKNLFRQKNIRAAESCLDTAILYTQSHDQKNSLAKMLSLMSDVQIAAGNMDSYVQYRKRYDSLQLELLNEPLLKNIQELETKYNVTKSQSEILNQKLVLAQKNRETVRQKTWIGIFIGCIIVLCLILFFIYRYYRQRQLLNLKTLKAYEAEQENIRLKASLDGQLQERQRISREMHDDMGSGLTSMLFLSRSLQGNDTTAGKMKDTAADLVQKMNEIIWTINQEEDTLDSLIAYIRAHIADKLEEAGIAYSFTVSSPLPAISVSQEFRRNIYLTVKEAVHNIIKHASATQVNINILTDNYLTIEIRDDGKGIDDDGIRRFGNGLKNMRYRMEQIGGAFTIASSNGVVVTLQVPLSGQM